MAFSCLMLTVVAVPQSQRKSCLSGADLLAKHKGSASETQHLDKCSGSFCMEGCPYPAGHTGAG